MTLNRRQLLSRAAGAAAVAALAPRRSLGASQQPSDAWIWDGHGHLAGVKGTCRERVDQLLSFADRMQIARLVVSMGLNWSQDPDPDDFRRQNDDVLEAIDHAPDRILGMVYLNPNHEKESLRELDRCLRNGPMIGVKLWVARRCNHSSVDAIVAEAQRLSAPVFQHTYLRVGPNLPGESVPEDLAALAERHPGAALICGHTGNDWERSLRAVRSAANIWVDLSGSDPTAGMTEMAVRELGAGRVVFGSDFGGRSFASQLAKVESARLPEPDRRAILADNLKQLLLPIMKAKGIKP